MRRLAFDTSVLAHLIRPTPAPGQEVQHADTLRLIGEQAENGLVYAVATPALAEILSVIGEAQVDAALTELRTIFEVLTFDLDAAQRCAGLLRGRRFDRATKVRTKFDAQIVATSLRWNADLCTFDGAQTSMMKAAGGLAGEPADFTKDGRQARLFPP